MLKNKSSQKFCLFYLTFVCLTFVYLCQLCPEHIVLGGGQFCQSVKNKLLQYNYSPNRYISKTLLGACVYKTSHTKCLSEKTLLFQMCPSQSTEVSNTVNFKKKFPYRMLSVTIRLLLLNHGRHGEHFRN